MTNVADADIFHLPHDGKLRDDDLGRYSLLPRFLAGEGKDDRGRMIYDVWDMSMDSLEECHDYIQRIFPLRTRSGSDPSAPLAMPLSIYKELEAPIKKNMLQSLDTMLAFYGFERQDPKDVAEVEMDPTGSTSSTSNTGSTDGTGNTGNSPVPSGRITKAGTFGQRKRVWIGLLNHNYKRITRIILSLKLFSLDEEAAALANCLDVVSRHHPSMLFPNAMYWQKAMADCSAKIFDISKGYR